MDEAVHDPAAAAEHDAALARASWDVIMDGLLASLYSTGDRLKKRVRGLLNPESYANAMDYSNFEPLTNEQLVEGLLGIGAIKVLHGTPTPFKDFDFSHINMSTKADHSGLGAFFSKADDHLARESANFYAGTRPGANVRMHSLDANKTYKMTDRSDLMWRRATNSRADSIAVREELLSKGFDSVVTPDGEIVALTPSIIKSWWGGRN